MLELSRGDLLRLGAGGLVAAAATGLGASSASAQLPVATPVGDDAAFLSFATVAERTSRDFYRAAYKQARTGLEPAARRHINRVATAKRGHIMRLDSALGADAPLTVDFVTVLPRGAVDSKARILALGEQLELLLVRAYLNGVAFAQDSATRLLLARLLTYDAQMLAWLRSHDHEASPAGIMTPLDLEPAADQLDQFLSTPDFPD